MTTPILVELQRFSGGWSWRTAAPCPHCGHRHDWFAGLTEADPMDRLENKACNGHRLVLTDSTPWRTATMLKNARQPNNRWNGYAAGGRT